MPSPAVEIVGLTKRYGGVAVVDGLSLTAATARVTAVLGPNGAGKTTTIECCEGLRAPDEGTVRVLGLDPMGTSSALRSRVGVMLQDGGLPSGARALEVLRHVAAMYAAPRDTRELAARLGLDAFARTPVRRLSGGQRQRLALATALVGRPELAFLDEPSAGLDPQARLAVWDLVRELRADGVSIVLTTHLMDEAEALADDVVILDGGRVIARGSPADLVAGAQGTESSTLRFAGPPGLAEAINLGLRDGRPGAARWAVSEVDAGRYLVTDATDATAADGAPTPALRAAQIAALSGWGAGHGALLTGFDAGRRTLEDVFLDLTGRSLR